MPRGVVKFFNPGKGFGFIAPDDGGNDIFVHISALERSGLDALNEGDQVVFEVEQDRRSGKLAAVDLKVTGSSPTQGRRPARSGFERPDRGPTPARAAGAGAGAGATAGSGSGVVKWFNPSKGFGFIQPNDGSADIFVHVSAVERAGLNGLQDGQAIAYDLEQDRRSGKSSATNLRLER